MKYCISDMLLYNSAAEYDEILHQLQCMKCLYETQEFSPADIDRIKASGMELKRQIDEMENRSASVDQDIWSVEMKISKEREKVTCFVRSKIGLMEDNIQIYHVWEGYLRKKIPVERRKIYRAERRGKFSLKTGIFRKYPSQTGT